jgi:hypothetical protein
MNSLPFYDIITSGYTDDAKKKMRQGEAIKTTTYVDPDLDALMQEASERLVPKPEDRQIGQKRRSGQQESKIDRLLRKKIEKL